jgi:hypothetical protein
VFVVIVPVLVAVIALRLLGREARRIEFGGEPRAGRLTGEPDQISPEPRGISRVGSTSSRGGPS